jgi:hypothetical protein
MDVKVFEKCVRVAELGGTGIELTCEQARWLLEELRQTRTNLVARREINDTLRTENTELRALLSGGGNEQTQT